MKLAWQNIVHDRARFSVTVLGVSFAVFLMVFQGSLLAGFLRAASRLIDASDSDIWITARGVQAFEFGIPIEGRLREMAAGVPGVLETEPSLHGFCCVPHTKRKATGCSPGRCGPQCRKALPGSRCPWFDRGDVA